jgi:Domain of unknown function (DUF4375)
MSKEDIAKSLDDFKNRKIYRELSGEILASIPDDKLEMAIVDFIDTKVRDLKTALADVSRLSLGLQMMYSTWILEGEVNNGGFNQFFVNSSGQFAEMALRSLKLLNATGYYEVLQRAINMHEAEKGNVELQELYRRNTLEAFSKSYKLTNLGECDDAFFKLREPLSELRVKYIRSHQDEFVGK